MKLTDNPLWITTQYICVLFLTVCFTFLLVSDLFVWFIAILFWLFIPAVIVACICITPEYSSIILTIGVCYIN